MAWKGYDFFPHDLKFPFIGYRNLTYVISGLLTLGSILFFLTLGPNYGVDFKGGAMIRVQAKSGAADLSELRSTLGALGLRGLQIQGFGDPSEALIRTEIQDGGEAAQKEIAAKVRGALQGKYDFRDEQIVGPSVSSELRQTGVIAVFVSLLAIMVYVWFRFEWQFAIGAALATLHDAIMTLGLFCLTQLEFDITVVAAILTIVGYSLNDTVVVYDRIRENLRKYKKMPLEQLLNLSINETLSRTIMTSVTVFLTVLALYFFGGAVIRNFAIAMMWGIFVGTYSSIFIAAPLLLLFGVKRDWSGERNPDSIPERLRSTEAEQAKAANAGKPGVKTPSKVAVKTGAAKTT